MIEAALSVLENDKQRNELAAFYEQYKSRFFGIAYSKLHNPEEAEDAIQETFLRVVDNPNKFFIMTNQERVRFVESIVRHVSVDTFNKNKKNNAVSIEDIGDNIMSDTISPEEKYITDASVCAYSSRKPTASTFYVCTSKIKLLRDFQNSRYLGRVGS